MLANGTSRYCWTQRLSHAWLAAGCNLSKPSRVTGPSGSTSHTATAMDPVHGSQWSDSSIDTTLIAKQGAALTSSYGSNSMGEVSTGIASTALAGQRGQPTDASRQLFIVDDTALTGHASHSAATHEVSTGTAPSALTGQRGPHGSHSDMAPPALTGQRDQPCTAGSP